MMIRQLIRATVLPLCIALLSGCSALQWVSQNAFLMSPEEEARLGTQLAGEVQKKYPVYRGDPDATAYVKALGRRLVQAAPPCAQQFAFELVNTNEVNAFAIPGGRCYVQVALLRETSNESELAGVIAHEIGHVVARHGAKAVSSSRFYDAVGQAALGQDAGGLAKLALGVWESGILLQHSRADESEADALSVETLPRAGIDPNGLVRFFQKLGKGQESAPGAGARLFSYLSTHPLTPERIAAARQRIAQLGPPSAAWQQDSAAFRRVKSRYPARPSAGK
jgi:predicted Zn-dependent protease